MTLLSYTLVPSFHNSYKDNGGKVVWKEELLLHTFLALINEKLLTTWKKDLFFSFSGLDFKISQKDSFTWVVNASYIRNDTSPNFIPFLVLCCINNV